MWHGVASYQFVAVAAVAGAMVGSFGAAVAWRVPRGASVISPRSACVHCGTPIPACLNIPVAGWLILRGRAKCCGQRISLLYPTVEAATASVWALLAAVTSPVWLLAVALLVSAAGLCAVAATLTCRHRPRPS